MINCIKKIKVGDSLVLRCTAYGAVTTVSCDQVSFTVRKVIKVHGNYLAVNSNTVPYSVFYFSELPFALVKIIKAT